MAERGKKAWRRAARLKKKLEAEKKRQKALEDANRQIEEGEDGGGARDEISKGEDQLGKMPVDDDDGDDPSKAASGMKMDLDLDTDTTTPSSQPNPYEHIPTAKHNTESLSTFLTRLPPSTSPTSLAPWIWIASPHHHPPPSPRPSQSSITDFKYHGTQLLTSYISHRHALETEYPDKTPGGVMRMLLPDRQRLETEILGLAREYGVLSGKWMLFVRPEVVDEVWARVARGTWEGSLGNAAKVATRPEDGHGRVHSDSESDIQDKPTNPSNPPTPKERVICIYTPDITDKPNIIRVLTSLTSLLSSLPTPNPNHDKRGQHQDKKGKGKGTGKGRPIYYKADAYTHLRIFSGNEYGLKASLYSSWDLLA